MMKFNHFFKEKLNIWQILISRIMAIFNPFKYLQSYILNY